MSSVQESLPDPEEAPHILEQLIQRAVRSRASDIHLQKTNGGAEISFRLDGVLSPAARLPQDLAERVFGRVKYLARLKTYQESLPQDGRIDGSELNLESDVRVATYPTVTGEKIVLRLFAETSARSFDDLQIPGEVRAQLEYLLRQPAGLLLLTGPAGSGKTTTIYACLRFLVQLGGRHIITIEDPAEQILPGVMQTEISEARGLDFAKAARHLLRQDPQVLVIGEIRDEETANVAVRAALTGHLVISTLHAGSCAGVLERLITLCPDRSAVASALSLVLNQRLLRRICADCAGKGCDRCLGSGLRGRLPIFECLPASSPLRRDLREGSAVAASAAPSLVENARQAIRDGLTTEAEAARVLGSIRTEN